MKLNDGDRYAEWAAHQDIPTHGYSRTSRATFDLPVSSRRLFVFSQGHFASGELNVFQGEDESDRVEVEVIAMHHSDGALAQAKVCAIHRDDSESGDGLVINTPSFSLNPRNSIRFIVNMKLPASAGQSTLNLAHLETDLGNFRHSFGDLAESVSFKSLTIRGSNAEINAKSLLVAGGLFKTSNGAIVGEFTSSGKLELTTSNAIIQTSIHLHDSEQKPSVGLVQKTSNGRLDTQLHLYSNAGAQSSGGTFVVEARTSNAAVSVTQATAPLNSVLQLEAHSSNGAANIRLHPAFEGTFHGSTSNAKAVVEGPSEDDIDPSGEGRQRVSQVSIKGTTMQGGVYWGAAKERAGSAVVKTSNAALTVRI